MLSLIGAGGMGELYRAHDTKLEHDAALKLLPPQFARDPDWSAQPDTTPPGISALAVAASAVAVARAFSHLVYRT